MTEDITIQCEQCGTVYIDLEEVCPYCGQPQPTTSEEEPLPEEPIIIEEPGYDNGLAAEAVPPDEDEADRFLEEAPPDHPVGLPPDEALAAAGEPLAEEPGEAYLDELHLDHVEAPFADDDIFAVAEPEWPADREAYDEPFVPLDELYAGRDPSAEYDDLEADEGDEPRRPRRRRIVLGCLGTFLCIGLFFGGIGLLGAYHGLQERVQLTQTEAETHYQKGQLLLAEDSVELAIAEFDRALSLNPNFLAAREALRDAQRISQSQPTPTSETRSAAAAQILAAAEEQMAQKNWAEAVQTLAQVRGLDLDYQVDRVSDLIYEAHFAHGRQQLSPAQIEGAIAAFEQALAERPDDPAASLQLDKALLYLDGQAAQNSEPELAVEAFRRLYRADAAYLDVKERLFDAYEAWGDELLNQEAWCQAKDQYDEALSLQPAPRLQSKADTSRERCQDTGGVRATEPPSQPQRRPTTTPAPAANLEAEATATVTATTTVDRTSVGGGSIVYSDYNPNESRWEIVSVPVAGGTPKVLVTNGTMPSVSPDGRLLLYRSELREAEGFHLFDLTTGEDRRITPFRQYILPRWGGDNNQFIFVAQEPATNRWQIHLGFADGNSEPIILRDGRTPDWSPDQSRVAFQGTDAEGNNPGLYIVPLNGGEPTRLTNHESDRSPDFSPDGSQLVYMSTRSGNWDIFTVSAGGSAPRQVTTAPGNDGLPVWSPDGSQIAYISDADGSWAIYIINAAGGSPFKVTDWNGSRRKDWLLGQIWWSR